MNPKRFLNFLNPISRLGKRKHYVIYPILGTLAIYLALETVLRAFSISQSTSGGIIIFISVATVIYFSFHTGIRGGIISSAFTVLYYLYLINSRNYSGQSYKSSLDTTILLGGLYFLIGTLIGWLKETVDKLIEKEAEGRIRLQSVIQQLPVGILIANENGIITHQNRRLEQILGYKMPKDFIVGKTSLSIGGNPRQTPLSRALLSGRSTNSKQFEIKKRDKVTYVLVNAAPVKNRAGKIVAAVSVIDDITREKQLEKRKDDFINIASHELKTPITSMKLYIDLLIRRLSKKDSEELNTLKRIQYQTDKLQMLVSNLLDVSKISNGKIRFNRETFKLDELVIDTIEEVKTISNAHEIKLEKSSVKVFADKFRIYQVLTNLLTNAIKFSPNSKQIIVSVGRKNGKAQVSVKDFGIGIGKKDQSKIFERLYQAEEGDKTFPGFGMGLYISRQIINRHDGKIWVESSKGSGSTFYFNLPIKE